MNNIETRDSSFAHVVLFKCPSSKHPIGTSFLSNKKNLEEVDSHSFQLRCECGWAGEMLGISRVKSWVEVWTD
jgi:hypothetical protein